MAPKMALWLALWLELWLALWLTFAAKSRVFTTPAAFPSFGEFYFPKCTSASPPHLGLDYTPQPRRCTLALPVLIAQTHISLTSLPWSRLITSALPLHLSLAYAELHISLASAPWSHLITSALSLHLGLAHAQSYISLASAP